MTQVIDVHTHMFSREWLRLVKEFGPPQYVNETLANGNELLFHKGAQFLNAVPAHFDYKLRLAAMDKAGVDVAVVSLTSPNCFFGDEEIGLRAARAVNDDMAQAQADHPDRIRWMLSVPWEHSVLATAEVERAHRNGAVGAMVLANINGRHLTDPVFHSVWKALDERGLPVLVHPTVPPGADELGIEEHNLAGSVGFMFDTTLAISRMIFDGFFDRYPNLKIIASHAGGALPYIVGRLDRCFEMDPKRRTKISRPPSEYLKRIYYDSVTYRQEALELCLKVGGDDNVMYGSDFPHGIGDMAGCLGRVDALPEGLSRKVRGENARRIFGL